MEAPDSDQKESSALQPDEVNFAPVGTMAVMVILAVVILSIWFLLYFGVFVPRGGIS